MHMKNYILIVLLGVLHISCKNIQTENVTKTPNIIFIMADDHAAQAVGCYGSQMNLTPNIDRIASEGALFENCFCTNSICSPSRAVILTGKYSHLNGVTDNIQKFNGLQDTYPKYLKKAGYQTAIAGKWHLKSQPTGFDYWNVLPGQGEYYNPVLIENGVEQKHEGYVTDIITDIALDWLNERDSEKPFCLMIHHKAIHANWETDDEYANMFSDIKIPEPPTFNDNFAGRSAQVANHQLFVGPSQWGLHYEYRFGEMPVEGSFQDKKEWMYQRYIKDYLKCVASVDDNIGRVLAFLDKTGLDKNTIIVYTSDQGFFLGEHGLYDKRFMYEESLRMPLVIRYPEEIKPATVVDEMVLNLDFAETILDYAGVGIPEDMQGSSFRQLALGESPEEWRDGMYYRFYEEAYGIGPCEGIRTQKHKLIHYLYDDKSWELYDLQNDPHEMENLYTDMAYEQTIEELKNEMSELRLQYKIPEE